MMQVWAAFVDGKPAGYIVADAYELNTSTGAITFRDDRGVVATLHRWDYIARMWPVQHKPEEIPGAAEEIAKQLAGGAPAGG